MTPQEVVFVLLALATGLGAVAVVTSRNLVHAALFLAATLGSMAGVFLVLHADFVALVQLLIYVGAIVVLLLFGLMLTRAPIGREALDSRSRGLGLVVSVTLFGVLGGMIWQEYAGAGPLALGGRPIGDIGTAIFSGWVLPFELVSMLLLAALIGAVVLARREVGESGPLAEPGDRQPRGVPEGPAEDTQPARPVAARPGTGQPSGRGSPTGDSPPARVGSREATTALTEEGDGR